MFIELADADDSANAELKPSSPRSRMRLAFSSIRRTVTMKHKLNWRTSCGSQQRLTISDYAGIAHQNLGLVAKRRGDINTGLRPHDAVARDRSKRRTSIPLPGTLQNNLSGVLIQLGDLQQAEQYSLGAVDYFRLTGKRLFESYALSRLSTIYRRQGLLDQAETTQLNAKAIREELGDRSGIAGSLISLAAIAESRGDLTRSRQFAQEAYETGVEIGDRDVSIGALQRIAKAELLLGQAQRAADHYAEAEAISVSVGDRVSEYASRHGKARAWIRLGELEGADAIAAELVQFSRENEMERHEAGAIALQAEVRMAGREWLPAVALLQEAAAIAERIGDDALHDATLQHMAEAFLELGDVERARENVSRIAMERADDPDVMVLQARLAAYDEQPGEALRLMTDARTNAGEAWSDDDEALLETYRRAATPDD